MGFLITITGLAGAAFANKLPSFTGWLLGPIWFIGFWYFTEKRFVIIRNAAYIRDRIEPLEPGLEWENFIRDISTKRLMRRVLPLDPYHLEIVAAGLVIGVVPWLWLYRELWPVKSFFFISALCFFTLYVYLAQRAWREYGRPQEHTLDESVADHV